MRYACCLIGLLALSASCGGPATESDVLPGINGGAAASQMVPEFGSPVSLRMISESTVDAKVRVRYLVLGIEVHRSQLTVPALATLAPVGPDVAAIIEINGEYETGEALTPERLVLGQDFNAGDVYDFIVPDPLDQCPDDPAKTVPGFCGCGKPETDGDGDGAPDCVDGCPQNSGKTAPGACGCTEPDADSDGDGAFNCLDGCLSDAGKSAPGACGCGVSDQDSDGDGAPDCQDDCPLDSGKTAPGDCGCGFADVDTDGDGALDCADECPGNSGKVTAGACGCDEPETDYDEDGVPNCIDDCPEDSGKVSPGACGCGQPDQDSNENGIPDCIDPSLADTDEDGVLDDGDGSGVAGDNPCTDGVMENCDDNCRFHENPDQEDYDVDGVGDACEIRADFDYDGDVDGADREHLVDCLGCVLGPIGRAAASGGGEGGTTHCYFCFDADLYRDYLRRVDEYDLAAFEYCYSGADVPVTATGRPACYEGSPCYDCN